MKYGSLHTAVNMFYRNILVIYGQETRPQPQRHIIASALQVYFCAIYASALIISRPVSFEEVTQ